MEAMSRMVLAPASLAPSEVRVVAGPRGVSSVELVGRGADRGRARRESVVSAGGPPSPVLDRFREQLEAYFEGHRTVFDVPFDPPAGTGEFTLRVWEVLRRIPWGSTWTYGRVAREAGRPAGARAVGRAVGRNPFPILVPCHRVVGADGRLTGFSSGLPLKISLLALEGIRAAPESGDPATRRVPVRS